MSHWPAPQQASQSSPQQALQSTSHVSHPHARGHALPLVRGEDEDSAKAIAPAAASASPVRAIVDFIIMVDFLTFMFALQCLHADRLFAQRDQPDAHVRRSSSQNRFGRSSQKFKCSQSIRDTLRESIQPDCEPGLATGIGIGGMKRRACMVARAELRKTLVQGSDGGEQRIAKRPNLGL